MTKRINEQRGTPKVPAEFYCKVCSNYHPQTNEFLGWKLTSFENK